VGGFACFTLNLNLGLQELLALAGACLEASIGAGAGDGSGVALGENTPRDVDALARAWAETRWALLLRGWLE
jgi:hypothetical protein